MRWVLLSLVFLFVLAGSIFVMTDPSLNDEARGGPGVDPAGSAPTSTTASTPTSTAASTQVPATPTTGSPTPEPPTSTPSVPVDLLPDLVTLQPSELTITVEEGRKLLRFSNDIGNMSSGILELFPGPIELSMCGDPANPGRQVFQRIYRDIAGYGYFHRGADTEFTQEMVGCMIFHPEHDHWHLNNFTLFELRDESGLVVRGNKTSTCMMDSHRAFNLPGIPNDAYYLYEGCSQSTPQGISVGWVDRYDWNLPDQYIEITGVPDGVYCLVSTADPDGQILELDKTNNTAWVRVEIAGDVVTPFPDQPCPGQDMPNPGPAPDPPSPDVFHDTLFWQNWSWNTRVNTEATERVFEGRWAMAVTYDAAWAGLALDSRGFNTTGYTHLQFMLHPNGQPLPLIYVSLTNLDEEKLLEVPVSLYASPAGGGWYQVRIPVSALGAIDAVIGQLHIEEGAGTPNYTYFLDAISFVPAGQ